MKQSKLEAAEVRQEKKKTKRKLINTLMKHVQSLLLEQDLHKRSAQRIGKSCWDRVR